MTKKELLEMIKTEVKKQLKENQEFGMRWSEFDKNGRMIKREKFFKSHNSMMTFLNKLTQSNNFNRVEAWVGNDQSAGTSERDAPTSI